MELATEKFIAGRAPRILEARAGMERLARTNPFGGRLNFDWRLPGGAIVRFEGIDYPVQAISGNIHAVNASGPITCKHYELRRTESGETQLLHHMTSQIGDYKLDLVVPENKSSKRAALKIRNTTLPRSTPKDRANARKKAAKKKRNAGDK